MLLLWVPDSLILSWIDFIRSAKYHVVLDKQIAETNLCLDILQSVDVGVLFFLFLFCSSTFAIAYICHLIILCKSAWNTKATPCSEPLLTNTIWLMYSCALWVSSHLLYGTCPLAESSAEMRMHLFFCCPLWQKKKMFLPLRVNQLSILHLELCSFVFAALPLFAPFVFSTSPSV